MNNLICMTGAYKSGLTDIELEELVSIAKSSAEKGSHVLMENYGKIKSIKCKSTSGDLVTNADTECEKIVIDYLNSKTPEISILAEESGYQYKDSQLKWCIDPLDGTTNYAHGYPFFACSIGLLWENYPILGAISVPALNEIYFASPHIGSFCNEEKINVSSNKRLEDSLLVTGFAYDRRSLIDNNYAEFCWLTHRTHGVRRAGAAAVDMVFVAAGRLDGYWERGLAKWDLAAGIPIVEMAGGVVTNYPKGDFNLDSGRILACAPSIHEELLNELSKVKPLNSESYGGKVY